MNAIFGTSGTNLKCNLPYKWFTGKTANGHWSSKISKWNGGRMWYNLISNLIKIIKILSRSAGENWPVRTRKIRFIRFFKNFQVLKFRTQVFAHKTISNVIVFSSAGCPAVWVKARPPTAAILLTQFAIEIRWIRWRAACLQCARMHPSKTSGHKMESELESGRGEPKMEKATESKMECYGSSVRRSASCRVRCSMRWASPLDENKY